MPTWHRPLPDFAHQLQSTGTEIFHLVWPEQKTWWQVLEVNNITILVKSILITSPQANLNQWHSASGMGRENLVFGTRQKVLGTARPSSPRKRFHPWLKFHVTKKTPDFCVDFSNFGFSAGIICSCTFGALRRVSRWCVHTICGGMSPMPHTSSPPHTLITFDVYMCSGLPNNDLMSARDLHRWDLVGAGWCMCTLVPVHGKKN